VLGAIAALGATDFRMAARSWLASSVPTAWLARVDEPLTMEDEIAIRRAWGRSEWQGGYAGLSWPEAYGGKGLGLVEEFLFADERARAGAPETLDTLGKYLAGPAILVHGTEAQRQKHLPRILAGEEIWCEGYSEVGGGSDLAAVSTDARRVGTHFAITGAKMWTSWATVADRCYLLARTSRQRPRHHNLSVFLFDMRQPAVAIHPIRQMNGASTVNEVVLTEARAASEELLGEENEGWPLVGLTGRFRRMSILRMGLARYVELQDRLKQARRCLTGCAVRGGAGDAPGLWDKLCTFRWHLMRLVELEAAGREWHGPAGIVKIALDCRRHETYWRQQYLEARSVTIAGGTSEIQRNVIASSVLNMARRPDASGSA
jgi:alkylation response protein AidB-like acyl-CoA dehydrogenase